MRANQTVLCNVLARETRFDNRDSDPKLAHFVIEEFGVSFECVFTRAVAAQTEHFTVMFDAPISKHKHPDSAAAADQAFGTLVGFVKSSQVAGQVPSGDWRRMALLAWTMVHGIAKPAIYRPTPFPLQHGDPELCRVCD